MAVYVDMLIDYGWRLGPSCHMTATTEKELHEFAISIGLKRSWCDRKTPELIHYDLIKSKRDLAISKGAIVLNRAQMCARIEAKMEGL